MTQTLLKPEEKKILVSHLIEAMNREELIVRETARILNLNPCYVSMFKNEKSWDSCPRDAWYRLTQWHNSRLPLKEYRYPEDEPKWMPKEKDNPPPPMPKEEPLPPMPKEKKPDKMEKPGKSVKLILNQAEMKQMQEKIADMEAKIKAHVIFIKELQRQADEAALKIAGQAENIDNMANNQGFIREKVNILERRIAEEHNRTAELFNRIEALEKLKQITGVIRGEDIKRSLVLFQRNIYNPKP